MSTKYISSQEYPSHRYLQFSVEAAQNKKNKEINNIYQNLKLIHTLRHGKIFQQNNADELWYIDPFDKVASRIEKPRLPLIQKWDISDLQPDDELFNKLTSIGGLSFGGNEFYPTDIEFPCRIKTLNGEERDLCLVRFSTEPPYQVNFKNVLLLDEIADIAPSDLALSHDLRLESTLAEEVSMAFYPYMVRAKNGKLFLYNGITQFASDGVVKGSDIVCKVDFSFDETYTAPTIPPESLTYVIGKWDNRFNRLFSEYNDVIKSKKKKNEIPIEDIQVPETKNLMTRFWKRLTGNK